MESGPNGGQMSASPGVVGWGIQQEGVDTGGAGGGESSRITMSHIPSKGSSPEDPWTPIRESIYSLKSTNKQSFLIVWHDLNILQVYLRISALNNFELNLGVCCDR